MFVTRAVLAVVLFVFVKNHAHADPHPPNKPMTTVDQLNNCEEQLSKYRKFILQAILSFEDVCDAYIARPNAQDALVSLLRAAHDQEPLTPAAVFHFYQPPEQRAEIWTFFKLLMAQFNDVEFTSIIRDAVIERCQIKSELQHDAKRNAVVLGKKQRFHSWGGKRSPGHYGNNLAAIYDYGINEDFNHGIYAA